MTKTEEKKLEKFLKENFGSRRQFNWEGEEGWEFDWEADEDGFSLSLDVWRSDSYGKAVTEATKT